MAPSTSTCTSTGRRKAPSRGEAKGESKLQQGLAFARRILRVRAKDDKASEVLPESKKRKARDSQKDDDEDEDEGEAAFWDQQQPSLNVKLAKQYGKKARVGNEDSFDASDAISSPPLRSSASSKGKGKQEKKAKVMVEKQEAKGKKLQETKVVSMSKKELAQKNSSGTKVITMSKKELAEKNSSEMSTRRLAQCLDDLLIEGKFKSFPFAMMEGENEAVKLKVGAFVFVPEPNWLCEIIDIRGLVEDVAEAVDENGEKRLTSSGKPMLSCDLLWIRIKWCYSSSQFLELPADSRYDAKMLSYMGVDEFVPTTSNQFHTTEVILASDIGQLLVTVYKLDDNYPASDSPSPLSHYHCSSQPVPYYLFEGDQMVRFTRHDTFDFVKFKGPLAPSQVLKGDPSPIKFDLHSTSNTPYNPSTECQIYSPYAKKWYSTVDLLKGHHTIATEEVKEQSHDLVPKELVYVANASMWRGRQYGVTGNAYIVMRAKDLVRRILEGEDEVEEEEINEIILAESSWYSEVIEREEQMGAGEKKLRVPPKGKSWACPESGVAL